MRATKCTSFAETELVHCNEVMKIILLRLVLMLLTEPVRHQSAMYAHEICIFPIQEAFEGRGGLGLI